MAIPHHFPSALVSNWQSAVAQVASRPTIVGARTLAAPHLAAPVVNFNDRMVEAAAAVAATEYNAALGQVAAAAWTKPAEQCAAAAFEWAMARIHGDSAAATTASAQLKAFGHCDP